MILCRVCGAENHHLRTVCNACGGFIQGRVENLDLFSTVWKLIERPGAAFLAVCLARYKNYSTMIPAVAGLAIVFTFFWFAKAGDHTASAFSLLAGGTVAGPPAGMLLVLLLSLLAMIALRIGGATVRFRNVYAVVAYAMVPAALSAVFLLPLVFFTFGRYFFTLNPPPWLLKPVSYYVFIALGTAAAAWSLILGAIGFRVLLDCRWPAAFGIAAALAGALAGSAWIVRALIS